MDMALLLPTSNSSLYPLLPQPKDFSAFKARNFTLYCYSGRSIQVYAARTSRKLRPSFSELIRDKWSVKVPSAREKFPWEERKQLQHLEEEEDLEKPHISETVSSKVEKAASSIGVDQVSSVVSKPVIKAPWIHGTKPRIADFDSQSRNREDAVVDKVEILEKDVNYSREFGEKDKAPWIHGTKPRFSDFDSRSRNREETVVDKPEILEKDVNCSIEFGEKDNVETLDIEFVQSNEGNVKFDGQTTRVSYNEKQFEVSVDGNGNGSSVKLPWERSRNLENVEGERRKKKSNTELAEKLLPEHELKRLRNISLRMFERIKVGAAGITQDLVDTIHKKWNLEEVVKLKFEEPLSCQMKRTHKMLENRTGGLVIWRSGSSVVLYRGTGYKMQCVQSFSKQNERTIQPIISDSAKYLKDLSKEELTDFSELNQLLDELGPRFRDWCGREPYPIDADLLPAIDPEYKPPFRLFPYGVRHSLTNKEMTMFRRVARTMAPHFALGRNRELQGLAMAMIKLWEKTAIVKIAIKHSVLNTRNERMAEELRVLTGGTLLSRNKEYIVFYRGNDFLPPAIMGTLKERKQLTYLKQDEEEQARQKALTLTLVISNDKTPRTVDCWNSY